METKMTLRNGFFQKKGHNYGTARLCSSILSRLIELPKGTKVIYAVFNKTDKQWRDSFTISMPSWLGCSGIIETRADIVLDTKEYLAKMYKKGYRFVHFEYEV